ncbi:MaoC family dehydratase N-terminal domain-containing protein [Bacillus sp. mrc49]|uniref:MaoC family dehydratase N-terminal domain-containing protein n=1 Tax=Bacillus sp. mrc49 TaxID=2054913 RepID=UPI000C2709FE|nr:MaoC family dehydratase N-terminal domain-containing protein [Bacillus sp. mrc49]PJN88798.1 MaoC family dehydratase [Bacillus sp. mrc49]
MFNDSIGKRSKPVKNIVERGAVRKFAFSIGDPHPIFIDEEAGRQSRYGTNIAPPTFPRVFDYGTIESLNLPDKGLIHGEQVYRYNRPLLVGEEITCYSEVKDYYEKKGKQGEMGFLALKNYGSDADGKLVFSAEQLVIINETIRKKVMSK